jgi:hypothetical protein
MRWWLRTHAVISWVQLLGKGPDVLMRQAHLHLEGGQEPQLQPVLCCC